MFRSSRDLEAEQTIGDANSQDAHSAETYILFKDSGR